MLSAINIGLAGLKAAETRVNVRAQNIVNENTAGYQPLVPVQTSQSGGPSVKVVKPPELSREFPVVDIASEFVDMTIAKQAYAASAKVIRTAAEMQKTLIDTFA